MRGTIAFISITMTLVFLLSSGFTVIGAPQGWTKDIGDTYFREATSSTSIDDTSSGSKSDIFFHTGHERDYRLTHDSWTYTDYVYPTGVLNHGYGVDFKVSQDEYIPQDNALYYMGVKYKTDGIKGLLTKTKASGEGTGDEQTTTITISYGTAGSWDMALSTDYDDFSSATVTLEFSDNDYEIADVPDAGDTTRVTSDNNHIVDLIMNEDNDILYIDAVAIGGTVSLLATITME